MADLRTFAQQQSVNRTDDGHWLALRSLRDGTPITAPWTMALAMEGRVFGVQFGDATQDPVGAATFGAGVVDLTELDFLQTIPATVAVIPLYYEISFLAIGTAAESGMHVVWGSAAVKHASGITPVAFNLRPGSSITSACTLSALSDTGGTGITVAGVICSRISTALTGVAGTPAPYVPSWSAACAGFAPVLEGGSGTTRQIAAYFPGQAGTGYFVTNYAELPIAAIS